MNPELRSSRGKEIELRGLMLTRADSGQKAEHASQERARGFMAAVRPIFSRAAISTLQRKRSRCSPPTEQQNDRKQEPEEAGQASYRQTGPRPGNGRATR
jgi:hypothetical protein